MKGLYYYKLNSPYSEDVTKNNKLTITEIDNNFLTLKNADVKDLMYDSDNGKLIIEKNDGTQVIANIDLSNVTRDFKVEFDKEKGTLSFYHNDTVDVIEGLIPQPIVVETTDEIIIDNTLKGKGTITKPLGVSPLEKTASYKAVDKVIDVVNGENLPFEASKGERYLTIEYSNEYGLLYDYNSVEKINQNLKGGWRVPTKKDWDNMLNALENCEECRNHNSEICNIELGYAAGNLLKSQDYWKKVETKEFEGGDLEINVDKFKGSDIYGMTILPSGYADENQFSGYFGERAMFWTLCETDKTDVFTKRFDYNKNGVVQIAEMPSSFCSLRLVKDYTLDNFIGVETIEDKNYDSVLVPTLNTPNNYTIWTTSNYASENSEYKYKLPNNGEFDITKLKYYLNEWDGEKWLKKPMVNGDSVIVFNAPNGLKNIEYYVLDDKLCSFYEAQGGEFIALIESEQNIRENKDNELKKFIESTKIELNDKIVLATFENQLEVKKLDNKIQNNLNAISNIEKDYLKTSDKNELIKTIDESINSTKKYVDDKIEGNYDVAGSSAQALIEAKAYADEKVDALDAEVTSEDGKHVAVKVTEVDGVITAVNVTETDIASADDLANEVSILTKDINDETDTARKAEAELDRRIKAIEDAPYATKGYVNDIVEGLDATVGSQTVAEGKHIAIEVVEENGKLTTVTVVENDIASASDLTVEINRAEAKELELNNAILVETQYRQDADKAINDKIGDVVEGKTVVEMIAEAQAAAEAAATKLDEKTEGHVTVSGVQDKTTGAWTYTIAENDIASASALTAETAAREAADTANANAITAETAAREEAITALTKTVSDNKTELEDKLKIKVNNTKTIALESNLTSSGTTLQAKLNLSNAQGNILSILDDGLYSKATLRYDNITNTLYFNNGEEQTIKLVEHTVVNGGYYDQDTKEIVLIIGEKDSELGGEADDIRIPAIDLVKSLNVNETKQNESPIKLEILFNEETKNNEINAYLVIDTDSTLKIKNGVLTNDNNASGYVASYNDEVKTVQEIIETITNRIKSNEDNVNENFTTIFSNQKTIQDDIIECQQDIDNIEIKNNELEEQITNISNDYLKSSDKNELFAEIQKLINKNQELEDTLNNLTNDYGFTDK